MDVYSGKELNRKIDSFLQTKFEKFPELKSVSIKNIFLPDDSESRNMKFTASMLLFMLRQARA